jgi:predicted transcriptional regulator
MLGFIGRLFGRKTYNEAVALSAKKEYAPIRHKKRVAHVKVKKHKRGGRYPRVTPEKIALIKKTYAQTKNYLETAKKCGVSVSSVYRFGVKGVVAKKAVITKPTLTPIAATPNKITIPRPHGGDPAVLETLMAAPKKTTSPYNYIHIYAALNDSHWLTVAEINEKLGLSFPVSASLYGAVHGLLKKGFIEAIKKVHAEGRHITHYRRKLPENLHEKVVVKSLEDLPKVFSTEMN